MAQRHDPLAALRQRNFLLYSVGRLSSAMAAMLFRAAIAWQVYAISESAWHLGLIGVAGFVPSLGLSLVGGAVADAVDRKRIAITAQFLALCTVTALLAVTLANQERLLLIYAVVFLVAVANAFDGPARQALVPSLVPREAFPNAIAVGSVVQQIGFVTGPAIAGGLIWLAEVEAAFGAFAVLYGLSILTLLVIRPRPQEGPKRTVSFSAIREGVQFVRRRQVLLGAMTLDMFAVIFGGATALLPIYAEKILDVGALGYGLLYASLDLGAMLTAIALVWLPPIKNTGRALLLAVVAFGFGTIVFGLSRSFPLSLAAYAFIGVADQISVVMRQTTIQLATPDELRGRVTSVNMLFIGASNQLGAVESGFVAGLTSATFAVVSGGAGCLAVVAAVWARLPDLRRYRISDGELVEMREVTRVPAAPGQANLAAPETEGPPLGGGGQG